MAELTNYNKLINNLEDLKLFQMRDSMASYSDMVSNGTKNFTDALYELTEKEKTFRRQVAMNACVKTAGFPFLKKIEDYDFSFQPSVNKNEIEDLLTLRFMEDNENILLIGSPGVGKTHLATAIGIEAALHRYSVHFMTCQQLIGQLKAAENENRLDKRLKYYAGFRLLIIDEIGYLNLDGSSTVQPNENSQKRHNNRFFCVKLLKLYVVRVVRLWYNCCGGLLVYETEL